MNNTTDKELFSLLVRVHNHSIQTYYHFPDVIIYGGRRLEREELDLLLFNQYLTAYYADSFGKLYRLSGKAEQLLYRHAIARRRRRWLTAAYYQSRFAFDSCN